MEYDLVVIGGGSAGYSAAVTAAEMNKKVCVIEKGPFGGLCILKGCMPSKTLIHSARIAELIKKSDTYGISVNKNFKLNLPYIINRKNRIIKEFADYRKESISKNKNITLIDGEGSFISKNELKIKNQIITGKNFLISTGSVEFIPEIPGLKETGYLTSDDILELKKFPKSIAILGGGPVGIEFAYYFSQLGVKVTIMQRSEQILSNNDHDCAKELEKSLKKKGVTIYTNIKLKKFSKSGNKKKIFFDVGTIKKSIIVDEILAAFGRKPDIETLTLEKAGITPEKGRIQSNLYLQTSVKNIYIAGDASSNLPVVNVAVEEGKIAAYNMFSSKKKSVNYRMFPMAVFSHPEFAWIGISEKEANEKKIEIKIGKYLFNELGKAICLDETDGFIKFIVNKKNSQIIGVSIIGNEASDLIHEAIPLLYFKATLNDLAKMPHLHPTFGEIYSYLVDEMV